MAPARMFAGAGCVIWGTLLAIAGSPLATAVLAWAVWGGAVVIHASLARAAGDAVARNSGSKHFRGLLLWIAGGVSLALSAMSVSASLVAFETVNVEPWWMPALLICGLGGMFIHTLGDLSHRGLLRPQREWAVAGAALRLIALGYLTLAVLVFAEGYFSLPVARFWLFAASGIVAAWIAETIARGLARLFQPPRAWRDRLPLGSSSLLRHFASAQERAAWEAPPGGHRGMIQLSEMWFLPALGRMCVPVLAGAAALAWMSTAVHEVPHGSAGLWSQFGKLNSRTLDPGLHVTLPVPFHQVSIVPRYEIQQVVLGMEADTGAPILWDRAHYVGEESQLVGAGEDLLTISVPVYYRIKSPLEYYRGTSEPRRLVRDVALRELLAHTLHRPAFEIMAPGRVVLAEELHGAIQARLDAYGTGVEIVKICLRDIHPPVEVAPAYQEVVSAIEDREAGLHTGEAYRAESLPRAKSDAAKLTTQADTHHETRMAEVNGSTGSFLRLLDSYQRAPEVFRIRQSYAVRDEALRGAKKLIVDETFRDRLPTVVDLRKTLNPDFVPAPVQDQPVLIPSLQDRLGEFDRAIEGYLQMGRGAIPAPDFKPADADNLLDKKQ